MAERLLALWKTQNFHMISHFHEISKETWTGHNFRLFQFQKKNIVISFMQLICVFFWCNGYGHLGECGFGEFRLSLLPSPVCAFQSTNRPRGRNGVYFQGSAPMIPFTFVIAFMLRPAYNSPPLTMTSTLYDLKHTLSLSTRHRLCLAIACCHAKYWTKMMSLKGLRKKHKNVCET